MNNYPLVSIIIPVYQGEKYVGKCIDSIFEQSYKNIELIIINDGSTDNTERIIKKYIDSFTNASIKIIYKYQKNKGQAAAINAALKLLNGDYIMWLDSDDVLLPNAINDLLLPIIHSSKNDFSIGKLAIVNESKQDKILLVKKRKPQKNDDFFKDLLLEKNILFGNDTVLVKKTFLFSRIKNNSIFVSPEGQNWQLMLPITYKSNWCYVDKVVAKQTIRNGSHSRQNRSYHQLVERNNNFIKLLKATIGSIPEISEQEINYYYHIVDIKYLLINFDIAFDYYQKTDLQKCFERLKEEGELTFCHKIKYSVCKGKSKRNAYVILRLIIKIKRKALSILNCLFFSKK